MAIGDESASAYAGRSQLAYRDSSLVANSATILVIPPFQTDLGRAYPFTDTAGTNLAVDPQFVNTAAKDYHLRSTSPAIDAATPTVLVPTADFAGVSRPQGAQADIGALEYKP